MHVTISPKPSNFAKYQLQGRLIYFDSNCINKCPFAYLQIFRSGIALLCANMRQAELLQSVSVLHVSCDALRSCGLPIARPVENGMSTQPGRRYYFGRSWIGHRLMDPDREHYQCFWRRSKARNERLRTLEFILQSDGASNFVEGKGLSGFSDQLLQNDRYRKPYISRDIVAFDLGIVDYAAEYATARSLYKDRKQDTKRKAARERTRAFDEYQIPAITTTTTVSRQYDRKSGQVPASTVKQYFAELLAPDKWSGRGNMTAEKFLKDLLDIDRSFTVTIDTTAAVKNAVPIAKTEMVPCSMIPRLWPLPEECRQNTSRVKKEASTLKDIISPSPRGPGQFPVTVAITNSDSLVDDVTLAGGPLYLAKLRDAKKAEESVAQQVAAYNAPENHPNAEQKSESVAVLRADEAISVDFIAGTEKGNQSSEKPDKPSADKNIVKSEVAASAQSKTEINGSDAATLKSATVGQVHDMEDAVEQGEERTGPAGPADPETPREKHTCNATESVMSTDVEQPTCDTENQGTTDFERINTVSVQEAIMSEDNTSSEVEAIQTDIINRSEIETVQEKEPITAPVELEQLQSEQKQIRSDIEWLKSGPSQTVRPALENGVFPGSDTEWANGSSSTRGVAATRRSDAFQSRPINRDDQSDMSESTERQVQEPTEDIAAGNPEPLAVFKKTLESVVSSQTEFQAKLDFAVSSQTDLEKELHSLRFYRDSEIQSLHRAIAQLQHHVAQAEKVNTFPDDYGSEIQYLKSAVCQLQHQLAHPKKNNGVPEDMSAIEAADEKNLESMNIENEERGAAEGEDSGQPRKRGIGAAFPSNEKATEQSADMLVITPALGEVRIKVVPEFAKQLFPQAPEFASNAFGQLSRSETRRVTALANQGWVLVSGAQDGSLFFQKRPESRLTVVRLAVKVLGGVIVVSSVILTMLVGYGYTTMI
ncbi:hypothetical protein V1515DRAFT_315689 [Lipomyces mesembrius]